MLNEYFSWRSEGTDINASFIVLNKYAVQWFKSICCDGNDIYIKTLVILSLKYFKATWIKKLQLIVNIQV